MILLTDKKLSEEEYQEYLYGENEPDYSFDEIEFSLEELTSDIFEEEDGSIFTIYRNSIYYIYLEFDFYKMFKDSGYNYNYTLLLEDAVKDREFIISKEFINTIKINNKKSY